METKPAIALLALLAIASAALAQSPTPAPTLEGMTTTFQSIWGENGQNWGAVAMIAVSLAILFVAIAFMAGRGLSHVGLQSWAKDELYQAMASALIIVTILGFVYFLSGLSASLALQSSATMNACTADSDCSDVGDKVCHFDLDCGPGRVCQQSGSIPLPVGEGRCSNGFKCINGACTMNCQTLVGAYNPANPDPSYHIVCARKMLNLSEGVMIIQADQLLNVNMRVQLLNAFQKGFDVSPNQITGQSLLYPWPIPALLAYGISIYPYAGVSMISDALGFIFPLLFAWISSFIAQEYFLAIIQSALFPVLLAAGVILRTFFFTRRLGGLLLAISIGLYTVYPLMYLLLSQQYVFSEQDVWYDRWNALTCQCDTENLPWWMRLPIAGIGAGYTQAEVCPVRFCSLSLPTMVLFGLSPEAGGLWFPDPDMLELDWLFTVIRTVGALMVPGFFIPVIIIIVTVSFIKSLSGLLGGDVEIAGLSRLL
jgi:hypothetical protein